MLATAGTVTTLAVVALLVGSMVASQSAYAAGGPPVGLGTVATYSVLGGQTVTNTGPTTLSGDLGVSPGSALPGFPPGLVGGATHAADAAAAQAQSDLVVAYDDAAGRAPDASIAGDLVGLTLPGGVYAASGPIGLSGTLTLDGEGDPTSTFIFQLASTLITASASDIVLINGAQACNVFWQVAESATLGTDSDFVGTIMALTSISVTTGTDVVGRALARNGAVTLDTNTFTSAECETATTPPETTPPETTPPETTPPATTPPGGTPPATTPPGAAPPGQTPPPGAVVPPGSSTPPGSGGPSGSGPSGGSTGPSGSAGQGPTQLARSGSTGIVAVGAAAALVLAGTAFLVARRRNA